MLTRVFCVYVRSLLFGNCGVARVSLMVARQLLGCSGGYLVILGGSVLLWVY